MLAIPFAIVAVMVITIIVGTIQTIIPPTILLTISTVVGFAIIPYLIKREEKRETAMQGVAFLFLMFPFFCTIAMPPGSDLRSTFSFFLFTHVCVFVVMTFAHSRASLKRMLGDKYER